MHDKEQLKLLGDHIIRLRNRLLHGWRVRGKKFLGIFQKIYIEMNALIV